MLYMPRVNITSVPLSHALHYIIAHIENLDNSKKDSQQRMPRALEGKSGLSICSNNEGIYVYFMLDTSSIGADDYPIFVTVGL